jgi:hypothetical protein
MKLCDVLESNGVVICLNTQFYPTVYGTLLKYDFVYVLLILMYVV